MPWHLEKRDGKTCVIKDSDGSTAGCHDSRASAIKQQRALYANESRMASMYAELDAVGEESEEPTANGAPNQGTDLASPSESLTAAMVGQMQEMGRTQAALVAALHQISLREPVVNVEAPQVTVEAPNVRVEAAKAPVVHVQLPAANKEVLFDRDPLTGKITGASVKEE